MFAQSGTSESLYVAPFYLHEEVIYRFVPHVSGRTASGIHMNKQEVRSFCLCIYTQDGINPGQGTHWKLQFLTVSKHSRAEPDHTDATTGKEDSTLISVPHSDNPLLVIHVHLRTKSKLQRDFKLSSVCLWVSLSPSCWDGRHGPLLGADSHGSDNF